MTLSQWLSTLRQLLHEDPGPRAWSSLLHHLDHPPDEHDHTTIGFDYAEEHLQAWPDTLRVFNQHNLPEDLRTNASIGLARTLQLGGVHLDDGNFDTLLTLPIVSITRLDLDQTYMGPDNFGRLLETSWFDALTHLNLSNCRIGDRGLQILARSYAVRHLTHLTLTSNQISDTGIMAWFQAAEANHLTHLDLSWNSLSPSGVEALVSSPNVSRLLQLELAGNPIDEDGAWSIAQENQLTQLTHLNLACCRLGNEGASWIIASKLSHQLQALDLGDNNLSAAVIEEFKHQHTGSPSPLTHLKLTNNPLGAAGIKALASSSRLANLTHLELSGNQLDVSAIQELGQADYFTHLTHLDLSRNPLTDEGVRILGASSRALPQLRSLNLTSTRIGPEGAQQLANSALAAQLHTLRIDNNRIGRYGQRALIVSKALCLGLKEHHLARLDAPTLRHILEDVEGIDPLDTHNPETLIASVTDWLTHHPNSPHVT